MEKLHEQELAAAGKHLNDTMVKKNFHSGHGLHSFKSDKHDPVAVHAEQAQTRSVRSETGGPGHNVEPDHDHDHSMQADGAGHGHVLGRAGLKHKNGIHGTHHGHP